jgi:hypothetical protein
VRTWLPSLALLALGLAGCQGWNNAVLTSVSSRPSNQPPDLVDKIDGNYKGPAALVAAQSPACPPGSFGKIEMGDQTLYFAYTPATIFVAPVLPDGTIHAVSGPAVLDGTVGGGRLIFTVRTPECESRYNLRWVL